MRIQEFVNLVNKTRKDNKHKWYYLQLDINGKQITIKGFNTWLQIFRIDGVDHSNPMEQKISQFKKHLETTYIKEVNLNDG